MKTSRRLVVVGHGAAGLAAALSASEQARARGLDVAITVLEKAAEDEAGGNTRWSPSNMSLAAVDRLAPGFAADFQAACGGRADPQYIQTLAAEAPAAAQWLESHGIAFIAPPYYLAVGPPRIQPVGGGGAIVKALSETARAAGVTFLYETAASALVADADGRVRGITVAGRDATTTLEADVVIIASGGFQGSSAMMVEHFGARADTLRLISPGTRFNTGDGIRIATAHGATTAGDWNGMHAEPVDPRSPNSAPVVLVYPYGIVVDRNGERFIDEGEGLVHQTWEGFARRIHFATPEGRAYAILDSRVFDIPNVARAIRSEVEPYRAESIEGLAALIEIAPDKLKATVETFNAAAVADDTGFDATRCDGLSAAPGLMPPKSNWARAIMQPPFFAYPLVGAVAYTFGGLATNAKAEVMGDSGPLPGLYAAGEVTGHFYGTAPNAVAVLRALVFGRIAGREAVRSLRAG